MATLSAIIAILIALATIAMILGAGVAIIFFGMSFGEEPAEKAHKRRVALKSFIIPIISLLILLTVWGLIGAITKTIIG